MFAKGTWSDTLKYTDITSTHECSTRVSTQTTLNFAIFFEMIVIPVIIHLSMDVKESNQLGMVRTFLINPLAHIYHKINDLKNYRVSQYDTAESEIIISESSIIYTDCYRLSWHPWVCEV